MSLFRPNMKCVILSSEGERDAFGQIKQKSRHIERCAIVRVINRSEKTSVRADSSGSRGAAFETVIDAMLLLSKNTKANIDDIVEVAGKQLMVVGKNPRYDLLGALDHYEIEAMIWRAE